MANKNILGFGKDQSSTAKPIGVAGEENNELLTYSIEEIDLFQKILKELKKFNMHLDTITNSKVTYNDAENYKRRI
jgi:hypothetical protein